MAEADGTIEEPARLLPVGERLRAAREAAGLSLAQMSNRTRITTRHLEAIEQGDYAQLPGRPYVLGFTRSYARALNLDEGAIGEAVRAELGAAPIGDNPRAIHQFEAGDPVKTPTGRMIGFALAAAALVVGAGVLFWRSYYAPSAALPSLLPAPTPAAAASPTPAATPAPGAATGAPAAPAAAVGTVMFTALDDKIWVKFYDGAGKQLMQKQMAKGETYTLPADAQNPKVWTGRPEALAISVNGKPVNKLAEVQKTVKDVPVSAAALLARPAVPVPTGAVPGSIAASGAAQPGGAPGSPPASPPATTPPAR